MEETATKDRPFFAFYDSTGPNAGTDTIWFTKGDYRYMMGAGVGMARGVSVAVYKSSKQVLDLFSGLEKEDHYSNTTGIDFQEPKSPVLTAKSPYAGRYRRGSAYFPRSVLLCIQ